MATIIIPSDAFQESAKRDFIESPHYDRNDESGIGFACTFTLVRSLTAGHHRQGYEPGLPADFVARTALSSSLMRLTTYTEDYAGAWNQHVYQLYKTDAAETDTVTSSGTLDLSLSTYSVRTDFVDTDTQVSWKDSYYNSSDELRYFTTTLYNDPWTHADFVADTKAIWDSKLAAWEASTSRTSEYWEYIGGTLTSGNTPVAGAAIVATTKGGSGFYKDVLWDSQYTGGQYYFYMPSLVTGLLCKMRLMLGEYGSTCTFLGVGGAGDSFVDTVTSGDQDGYTTPIAGSSGVTIATSTPSINLYPYTFAAKEYHQRAYKGNPITQ